MPAEYYDGPQLTGEAITSHSFCIIDASATPDTVIMADNGTVADIAFVSQVPLDSGQVLYGMQDNGFALLRCATAIAANIALTSGANGIAVAATTGDYVYAVSTEPAIGGSSDYLIRCKLVDSPIVQP